MLLLWSRGTAAGCAAAFEAKPARDSRSCRLQPECGRTRGRDEREPFLAMFERLLAACGFQLHTELETLDTTLDKQIDAMSVREGPTSLSRLSLDLLHLAPRLLGGDVPFVVDGVAAAILYGFPLPYASVQVRIQDRPEVLKRFTGALSLQHDPEPLISPHRRDTACLPRLEYIYDLRDPDLHWLADFVRMQVRTQLTDPCADSVTIPVRYYPEEITVSVVPLQRIILPRAYARALERMRQRLADREMPEGAMPGAPR